MVLYFLMHIDLCSKYKKKISKTKFKKVNIILFSFKMYLYLLKFDLYNKIF